MRNLFSKLAFAGKLAFIVGLTLSFSSCLGAGDRQGTAGAAPRYAAPAYMPRIDGIMDYGDPNARRFFSRLQGIETARRGPQAVVRIVQLGDSHTAADIFTGELRRALQSRFGVAGIGWTPPAQVPGQRHSLVVSTSKNWELLSSRTVDHPDYPMGGFIARPVKAGAKLSFSSRGIEGNRWQTRFLIKRTGPNPLTLEDASGRKRLLGVDAPLGRWSYVTLDVRFPFSITAPKVNSAQLGGIWFESPDAKGVVISPVAYNGARQISWQRWSPGWVTDLAQSNADLVIIAYGSNEAFAEKLDLDQVREALRTGVKDVRDALPNAAILIVGAPDSMMKSAPAGQSCSSRQPPHLQDVRMLQRQVAERQKTLYWDWQNVMGGDCRIEQWAKEGLAQKDLVHLTEDGYRLSADRLYSDILAAMRKTR